MNSVSALSLLSVACAAPASANRTVRHGAELFCPVTFRIDKILPVAATFDAAVVAGELGTLTLVGAQPVIQANAQTPTQNAEIRTVSSSSPASRASVLSTPASAQSPVRD
jgi:hypothetical protein